MRLYIIGPVTGIEDDNRPAFAHAREDLRSAGYDVKIPHDFIVHGTPHDRAMLQSVHALTQAKYGLRLTPYFDGVAMLEGWEESVGARLEKQVAEACGIPCKTVDEWLEAAECS